MGAWLRWSLGFFTEPVQQNPHLDITLQLDLTEAHAAYQQRKSRHDGAGSFFGYLLWHLARALACQPSFNLRWVDGEWFRLHNPPIFVPVAVGGETRFRDLLLEGVKDLDYAAFLAVYQRQLEAARRPDGLRPDHSQGFRFAHFIGNLPYLRFTALSLHWRADQTIGQSIFYFGQRYREGERLMLPLSVKLHHACTDPLVLNELLADFTSRCRAD